MRAAVVWGALVGLLLALMTTTTTEGAPPPSLVTVSTPDGDIQGVLNPSEGFTYFFGIPFSEPPGRWEVAQPKAAWAPNVLNATQFGPTCPQDNSSHAHIQSEDCLFLNLWVPISALNSSSTPLPVMAFIHGGAFMIGAGSMPDYQGNFFASSTTYPTLLVTFNYRLGALGWMAIGNGELNGNFGFLDQQLALKWIQRYISFFGGDPKRVTLFGQSAGGISVTAHLVSPSSSGLFSRALVESNPTGICWRTPKQSNGFAELLAMELGCIPFFGNETKAVVDCLKRQPFEKIVAASRFDWDYKLPLDLRRTGNYLPWQPTIDGEVFLQQPLAALRTPSTQYPWSELEALVWGTVRNETGSWSWGVIPTLPLTEWEYKDFLRLAFGKDVAEQLEALYPLVKTEGVTEAQTVRNVMTEFSTDFLFYCPSRAGANATTVGGTPTYSYIFGHSPSDDLENGGIPECSGELVCHAAEIPFVFRSNVFFGETFTPAEEALAERTLNAWSGFAAGNKQMEASGWVPFYSKGSDRDQVQWFDLQGAPTVVQEFRAEQCDFWDQLGYYFNDCDD